jgi:hypothetical protein
VFNFGLRVIDLHESQNYLVWDFFLLCAIGLWEFGCFY